MSDQTVHEWVTASEIYITTCISGDSVWKLGDIFPIAFRYMYLILASEACNFSVIASKRYTNHFSEDMCEWRNASFPMCEDHFIEDIIQTVYLFNLKWHLHVM